MALEEDDTATYLGINITNDLKWHNQVSRVASKGNRALGFVKRNINTSSRSTKETAYKILVRPFMEYASTVRDPHQKIQTNNIEKVQKRAARYVTQLHPKSKCDCHVGHTSVGDARAETTQGPGDHGI